MNPIEGDIDKTHITLNELALTLAYEINNKPNSNPGIGITVITDLYFTDPKITLDDRVAATEIFLKALNDESRIWLEEIINGKNRIRTIIDERKKIFTANGTSINQRRR